MNLAELVKLGMISWLDIGFLFVTGMGLGAFTIGKLLYAPDKAVMGLLVNLLRDVQYEESRALIELSPHLRDQIGGGSAHGAAPAAAAPALPAGWTVKVH